MSATNTSNGANGTNGERAAARRPLIGLTGRQKKGDKLVGNPAILHDLDFDMYYSDYARGILEAGGMPLHLPIDVDPAEVVGYLDGVLLSGGADIAPENYGRVPETDLFPPEVERDSFEMNLLDHATAGQVPILGICRGIQMVNIHAGGTLNQHVPEHAGFDRPPTTELHSVTIEADSALGAMYGSTRSVNSLHHQTLDEVGSGLRVTARSDDGTIEGVEHTTLPIVAVQWHPEMMANRIDDPIFEWLVDAAR